MILTYASYLTKKDDVALSGLTATAANEFAEVILGGSIVIPAAVAFFGVAATAAAADSIFNLGFITMPALLQQMAFGRVFGVLWFVLLFLAGITSSISAGPAGRGVPGGRVRPLQPPAVLILAIGTSSWPGKPSFPGPASWTRSISGA